MLLRVLYGVLWVLTGSAGLRNGTMRCTADAPKKSSWLAGTAMALVYFGILWLVRNTEFTAFATPVISRLNSARRNS